MSWEEKVKMTLRHLKANCSYQRNRELISYSVGKHKDAQLVYHAFMKVNCNLSNINIFHIDRGNEFKNKIIDEVLETFNIKRSLSKKGCPYDNGVAEATYRIDV